jgi:hypothetical protein
MTVMTAQDAYAALLRDHIGPALRSIGFRGSGGAYTLPHPEFWVRIGVPSSAWNTRDKVSFTLNVTVIPKDGWERLRRRFPGISAAQPQANTAYDAPSLGDNPGFWQTRIGQLLVPPGERWWTLFPDSDLIALSHEVMVAVRDGALPAIAARTTAISSN